ncbi:MAG: M50 family metallopeptidase [Candidatus ainarchaeum sp.]|nr:M50 family metallopeptidase [Candidatus ainarchaeum sp.]MDD3976228.1 M50 family metallopeptidase [Candidatus ainarchaeum sp.]
MNLEKTLNILLFPGITIHELAHITACILLGVKIKKTKIFGINGGYVVYNKTNTFKSIIISFFPFIFNILISIACVFLIKQNYLTIFKIIFIWIGVSALYSSVPSIQDSKIVFEAIKNSYSGNGMLKWIINLLFLPLTIIVLILAFIFKNLDQSFIFRIILICGWIIIYFL